MIASITVCLYCALRIAKLAMLIEWDFPIDAKQDVSALRKFKSRPKRSWQSACLIAESSLAVLVRASIGFLGGRLLGWSRSTNHDTKDLPAVFDQDRDDLVSDIGHARWNLLGLSGSVLLLGQVVQTGLDGFGIGFFTETPLPPRRSGILIVVATEESQGDCGPVTHVQDGTGC
jgi:hypothetical protein